MKYLSSKSSALLDQLLMQPRGAFTLNQLMELAGLAVAQCVIRSFPPLSHRRVSVICGPGNQGGDGLVAARHLYHFGYLPTVIYPKQGRNEYFKLLVDQCKACKVQFKEYGDGNAAWDTDLMIDAIFGFSFEGTPRPPFDTILQDFTRNHDQKQNDLPHVPVLSVDIPSGWDVDRGNLNPETSFVPDVLISLTAPKTGSFDFNGKHYLGGRFVPPDLEKLFDLDLPKWKETNLDQCMDVSHFSSGERDELKAKEVNEAKVEQWKKEGKL